MKGKINEILPKHILTAHSNCKLFIADYKSLNGGNVNVFDSEPNDIKCIKILNPRKILVCFDGFQENALPLDIGTQSQQCEGVLFPDRVNDNDWVLFVETKYSNSVEAALDETRGYPNKAINQIKETVKYFRDKGIIARDKKVSAIISFPVLMEEFNSTILTSDKIMEVLLNDKIIIRGTNIGTIISEKRIKLGQ